MAFTDHASLFAAIDEAGINRAVQIISQQRPSWFNYATAAVAAKPQLLCRPIDANPAVQKYQNPLLTIVPPAPVVGTNGVFGLDYCVQLAVVKIDFAPGNAIALPAGLGPLGEQRLAVQVEVTGGLAFPPANVLAQLVAGLPTPVHPQLDLGKLGVSTVIPTTSLTCFKLDVFVVLGAAETASGQPPKESVAVAYGGMKIVGLLADQLGSIVEQYVNLVMQLGILPYLKAVIPTVAKLILPSQPIPPQDLVLPLTFAGTFSPSPASVPRNPAIEQDQLKLFVDLAVSKTPPGVHQQQFVIG